MRYNDMNTNRANTPNRRRVGLLIVAVTCILFSGCFFLDLLTVKVLPVTVGSRFGGKKTVYFKDADGDELFLSINGERSNLWDTNANIAILYKPVFFKTTGDTLHIMGVVPDTFHPQSTDALIVYHWREGNPLCYETQAKADGYKIIHSLWTIDEYNQ